MSCTLAEEGIYLRLLFNQWMHPGCQLTDDIHYLRRLCKKQAKTAIIEKVLEANFEKIELGQGVFVWRNARLYVEFCRAMQRSEKARESVKHRKERPLKQSNDSRTIEHPQYLKSVNGQSIQNQNQNHIQSEEEKKPEPPRKMELIARKKAEESWLIADHEIGKASRNESNLIISEEMSRVVMKALGLHGSIHIINLYRSGQLKDLYLDKYVAIEQARFLSRKASSET
jgi:uncharacterized protein YdaU (DUF1376 family)